MYKLPVIVLLLWGAMETVAQTRVTDSLTQLLQQHNLPDTVRLNLLNDAAFGYVNANADKGLAYASQAVELATRLGNTRKLAAAFSNAALNEHTKGKDSAALAHYVQALDLYTKLKLERECAGVYHNVGVLYFDQSDYVQADNWQQKALAIFDRVHDTLRKVQTLNSIGSIHLYLSDYKSAIDDFLQAISIAEPMHLMNELANAYTNLGITYTHLEQPEKALGFHHKSLQLHEQNNNLQGIAYAYNNLGSVYDDMDDTTNALNAYRKAFSINQQIGNKRTAAGNLANIGIVYNYVKNYTMAENYMQQALALYRQVKDHFNSSLLLDELANLYASAPQHIALQQKGPHLTIAENYAKTSLPLAIATGSLRRQSNTWKTLSAIYEKQTNSAAALDAYKKYISLRDSISNDDNRKSITRREIQFEFDKKQAVAKAAAESERSLAAEEIKRQRLIRNISVAAGILLLLCGTGLFISYKRRRDAQAKTTEAEFKVQVTDTEMKALRAQMNPHFIFNSLNSINDYISRNDTVKAGLYLEKFAKIMRMILEHSELKDVPLSEDLKALELYIQLESVRLNHSFTYELLVDPEIDIESTLIPPLILQPFVENSIWHGLSAKKEAGKITIHIYKAGNMLHCIVVDNGVGRKQKNVHMQEERQSMGIKITKERIAIIRKTKQAEAALVLTDLQQGTKVEVTLPLELNF